jgi:hypothetical protein
MDKSIKQFAEHMQFKLNKNKYKDCSTMKPNGVKQRSWDQCNAGWLLYRLRQELMELEETYVENPSDLKALMDEAADVGNFAMMIFDNANKKLRV